MKSSRASVVTPAFVIGCLSYVAACDADLPEFVEPLEVPGSQSYPGSATSSVYLTMSDGVRIATDVTLPHPLPANTRIPTIVSMTRYWRAAEGDELNWRVSEAALRGYAFVFVDERGTGASFGEWPHPWSHTSIQDFYEVVDWVIDQPWSNGQVGAWGISYLGMTAQFLPVTGHPAVRAVIPQFTQYDVFTDIAFPGGIYLDWFVSGWTATAALLDANRWPGQPNRSVKLVDSDWNGALLEEAVSEHSANGDTYEGFRIIDYRDELSPLGITVDDISAHSFADAIEASDVALYGWGSWMDHATAHSVITRFQTLDNPQRAVIGAWTHGGWGHASPYKPAGTAPEPGEWQQWQEALNFLDQNLLEQETGTTGKILYYYTMGAEEWRSTAVWPVEGMAPESWYFRGEGTLSAASPPEASARDTYMVDFTASTGTETRWHTALGGPVVYPDRRSEDSKLLTYTSPPLSTDVEITGYPVVTLYVASTHTDGSFFVYLEDVDENGRVTYVTEGQLRALHRKVSVESSPYELSIPYHSFQVRDGAPLMPGELTEVTFGLLPTSVVIRAGHRIRVAIAGHDDGLFKRIPDSGIPVITVERGATHPSRIELPVVHDH